MRKSPILLSLTILLIASLACGVPAIPVTGPIAPTLDSNALGTAILQTMDAAMTRTAAIFTSTPTVTPTFTPAPPTFTPTETASPTPFLTATPLIPIISVSLDTNCRVGPGQVYDQVGALLIGETTEVLARDPSGKYWYVKNPDKDGEFCWLWGKYAEVSGNIIVLPMYTPPPTPTPAPGFDANYAGLEKCSGWWVDLDLTNNGGLDFKSISVIIRDTSTNADISMYADQFKAIDACIGSTTKDVLHRGETATVSVPAFSYDPSGHKLRATITLCSNIGQNGACVTKIIKFSP